MKIETKFNVGDKVFTIDSSSLKVKEFEVDHICTWTNKGKKTNVTLYDGESYSANGYDENKCFSTEADLLTFVTTKEKKEK